MCYFFKIAVTVMIAIHLTTGGCVQTHVFEKALKSMDAPQGDPIDPSGWYDASYAWRDDSPTHWEYKNEPRFFQYEPFFEATYDSSTSDNGPKSNSDRHRFWHHHDALPNKKSNHWPPITPPKKRPTIGSQERTTRSPVQIAQCVRSCPVTSEFNPVCGSNNITYANPGRLECAQFCGIDVQLKSKSSCSAIIPRPTLMPTPAPMKPTRRTTINTPSPTGNFLDTTTTTTTSPPVTISQDILNSIFTSSTPDDNYDIDIRTRAKLFPPQYVYPVPVQKKRG